MSTPDDFAFLDTAPGPPGNGGPPNAPLPESEIARLLQYVPHGQMHPALLTLAGHFAAKLGPREDEILAILEPATRQWEQPVDLEKVRKTVADVVEMERQKRVAQDTSAPPEYDDAGFQATVLEPGPDVGPPPDREQTDGTGDPRKGTTGKKPTDATLPYEVLSAPEYMRTSFLGAARLVPGIGLTACGVGVLSGQGGDGKSVQALNFALGWTGDASVLPEALRPPRPLRVLFFMVEDSPGMVQERLRMMLGSEPAPSGLLLFTRKEPMQFGGAKGRPLLKALDRLAVTVARHAPVDVVGFDPLVYLHQAEENSASEMMRWLVPFREVCRQAGAALFVVHHSGWAPDGEDARGRGSTAIRAWADCELALRAQTKAGRVLHRLNLVKANFCSRWKEHLTLELDPTTLRFTVVDEAAALCSPESLVAWLTNDHNGVWTEKRATLYEAICKRFGCEERTAQEAVRRAKEQKLLLDEGQRKPLRVSSQPPADSQETLL